MEQTPRACEVETLACSVGPDRPDVLERLTTDYRSIIDHVDTTINFERTGRTPYPYYVHFKKATRDDPLFWVDHDLVRVPLTFTRLD